MIFQYGGLVLDGSEQSIPNFLRVLASYFEIIILGLHVLRVNTVNLSLSKITSKPIIPLLGKVFGFGSLVSTDKPNCSSSSCMPSKNSNAFVAVNPSILSCENSPLIALAGRSLISHFGGDKALILSTKLSIYSYTGSLTLILKNSQSSSAFMSDSLFKSSSFCRL